MRKDAYECDCCGTPKTPSNNWRLIFVDAKGLHLYKWDVKLAKRKTVKHLCGEACVHKTVGKHLAPATPTLVQNDIEEENIPMAAISS